MNREQTRTKSCIICRRFSDRNSAISYHAFPKDDTMKDLWLNSIQKTHPLVKITFPSSVICSKHFAEKDIIGSKRRHVRHNAVPCSEGPTTIISPESRHVPQIMEVENNRYKAVFDLAPNIKEELDDDIQIIEDYPEIKEELDNDSSTEEYKVAPHSVFLPAIVSGTQLAIVVKREINPLLTTHPNAVTKTTTATTIPVKSEKERFDNTFIDRLDSETVQLQGHSTTEPSPKRLLNEVPSQTQRKKKTKTSNSYSATTFESDQSMDSLDAGQMSMEFTKLFDDMIKRDEATKQRRKYKTERAQKKAAAIAQKKIELANKAEKDLEAKKNLEQEQMKSTKKKICKKLKKSNRKLPLQPIPFRAYLQEVVPASKVCHVCGKVFSRPSKLNEHLSQTHSTEKHACTICNKKFSWKINLIRHQRTVHEKIRLTCDKCDTLCIDAWILKLHKIRAHFEGPTIHFCNLCDAKFKHPMLLKEHVKKHRQDEKNGGHFSDVLAYRQLGCLSCDLLFSCRVEFRKHHDSAEHADEKYFCKKCEKTHTTYKRFYAHYVAVHKKEHTCKENLNGKLCSYRTFWHANFVRHMNSHTRAKLYGCDLCHKEFTTKDSIRNHMRIHTGERPFKCTFCKMRFSDPSTHSKHQKRHQEKKRQKSKKNADTGGNYGDLQYKIYDDSNGENEDDNSVPTAGDNETQNKDESDKLDKNKDKETDNYLDKLAELEEVADNNELSDIHSDLDDRFIEEWLEEEFIV